MDDLHWKKILSNLPEELRDDIRFVTADSGIAKVIAIHQHIGKRGQWVCRMHEAAHSKEYGTLLFNSEIFRTGTAASSKIPKGITGSLQTGVKVAQKAGAALGMIGKFMTIKSAGEDLYTGYKEGNMRKAAFKVATLLGANRVGTAVGSRVSTIIMTAAVSSGGGALAVVGGALVAAATGYIVTKTVSSAVKWLFG